MFLKECFHVILGKDKIGYTFVYGLGQYFKTHLLQAIQSGGPYSVLFDKSLSNVAQKQQLDICIRYCVNETDSVSTRYLTSVFLHNTTAEDLLKALKEGWRGLNLKKTSNINGRLKCQQKNVAFVARF